MPEIQRFEVTCGRPHNQKVALPAGIRTLSPKPMHFLPHTLLRQDKAERMKEEEGDSGTSQSRNHPRHDSRTVSLVRTSPGIKTPWEERARKIDRTHTEAEMTMGLVPGAIEETLRKTDECGATSGGVEAEGAGETAPGAVQSREEGGSRAVISAVGGVRPGSAQLGEG